MRRYRPIIIVPLLLFMVACVGTTPERSLLFACETYTSTLKTLAAYNAQGRLSRSQVDRTNSAVQIIAPICEGTVDVPDARSALDAIELHIEAMVFIKQGTK